MADLPYGRDTSSAQGRVLEYETSRSYYSGADCAFEFDDIPVDDIAYVALELVEPIKLHYGYASRYRLRTSRGVRMVSGQFSVNFKDPIYIKSILEQIRTGNLALNNNKDYLGNGKLLANNISAGRVNPNQAKQNLFNNQTLSSQNSSKPSRERLESYRDILWGTSTGVNTKADNLYKERLKASGNKILDKELSKTEEFYQIPNPGQGTSSKFSSKPGGFDLKIICGEPEGYGFVKKVDQAGRQVGAVRLINGVEIISESMEITETGEPIRLNYKFTAADVF